MEKKKIELGFAGGKDGDKGGLGSLGWACHTAIFKMDNHMDFCSILCESLDGSCRGWGILGKDVDCITLCKRMHSFLGGQKKCVE